MRPNFQPGLSEPGFCGGLVCEFKKVVGGADFSGRFGEVIICYKCIGCGMDIMRWSVCLVVGPVAVGGFASLFSCTLVG